MSDPLADALATLMALGLVVIIGRELVTEKSVKQHTRTTRTCAVTEVTLPHYDFDGFSAFLVLHLGYMQSHHLSSAGHDAEPPQLTSAVVVHAILKDQYRNTHQASALELRQIQQALDDDRSTQGYLQRALERDFAET